MDKKIKEMMEEAKTRQNIYEESSPKLADPATVSNIAKIPFKALSVREVIYHRFVDINNTIINLIDEDRWVPALILIRCSIESTALLHQLGKEIDECLKTGIINKADAFLIKVLIGRGGRNIETRPTNIQSAINSLDLEFHGFKNAYKELSAYAHPTFDSLFKAYAKWDNKTLYLHLGKQDITSSNRVGLSILLLCMGIFETIYNRLPDKIMEFSKIFESELKAKRRKLKE